MGRGSQLFRVAIGTHRTAPTVSNMLYEIDVVSTSDRAAALARELIDNFDPETTVIAFDTETEVIPDSRVGFAGDIVTAQFAAVNLETGWSKVAVVEVWRTGTEFLQMLADAKLPYVAHNAQFDCLVLRRAGGVAHPTWKDTMLADGLINLGTLNYTRSLAELARTRLGWTLEGKDGLRLSFKVGETLARDQLSYAALDAVATLHLWLVLRDELEERGLVEAFELEMGALPGLVEMSLIGLPCDADAWRREVLDLAHQKIAEAEEKLDRLTGGGGQQSLFGGVALSWSPDSEKDLRKALNTYEDPEILRVIFPDREKPRFGADDPADKTTIKRLANAGSEIAKTLLEWREWHKILTTYGEDFLALRLEDGRFHPNYNQAIVATGRWNSDRPNGQNLSPKLKKYMRAPEGRSIIMLDYANMEMRVGAELANDKALIDAFNSEADIHSATASLMFGIDLNELLEKVAAGDEEASMQRKKAKPVNFGSFYGISAQKLWEGFVAEGIEMKPEEAKELLDRWFAAYADVDRWVRSRDAFVEQFAQEAASQVDYDLVVRLDETASKVYAAMGQLRRSLGRRATPEEIVEFDSSLSVDEVLWVWSYGNPVLVDHQGTPVEFVSETVSGRKRRFQFTIENWYTTQLHLVWCSPRSDPFTIMEEWRASGRGNINISPRKVIDRDGNTRYVVSRKAAERAFAKKSLKRQFIQWIWEKYPARAEYLKSSATVQVIRKMANAYRNAPVQGGAAEPMQAAIGMLWPRIRAEFPQAHLIQTVHDSLVLEAPTEQAEAVAELARQAMKDGFYRFFKKVPIGVDVEISPSFDASEGYKLPDPAHAETAAA